MAEFSGQGFLSTLLDKMKKKKKNAVLKVQIRRGLLIDWWVYGCERDNHAAFIPDHIHYSAFSGCRSQTILATADVGVCRQPQQHPPQNRRFIKWRLKH